MELTKSTINMIVEFEGCPSHPEWPGGYSGITIGLGSDIGANPISLHYWRPHLPPADFTRLNACRGIVGQAARRILPSVADIDIPRQSAMAVFLTSDIPAVVTYVQHAFPGSSDLPSDSFGAMVDLVYNRGASLCGPDRTEMAAIHSIIQGGKAAWPKAVVEFADMARLWPTDGKIIPTPSNLAGRRLRDAALFAAGLRTIGSHCLLYGDTGPDVAIIQRALGIKADGSFGPGTMIDVWQFQKANDIDATGVVDLATYDELIYGG